MYVSNYTVIEDKVKSSNEQQYYTKSNMDSLNTRTPFPRNRQQRNAPLEYTARLVMHDEVTLGVSAAKTKSEPPLPQTKDPKIDFLE